MSQNICIQVEWHVRAPCNELHMSIFHPILFNIFSPRYWNRCSPSKDDRIGRGATQQSSTRVKKGRQAYCGCECEFNVSFIALEDFIFALTICACWMIGSDSVCPCSPHPGCPFNSLLFEIIISILVYISFNCANGFVRATCSQLAQSNICQIPYHTHYGHFAIEAIRN